MSSMKCDFFFSITEMKDLDSMPRYMDGFVICVSNVNNCVSSSHNRIDAKFSSVQCWPEFEIKQDLPKTLQCFKKRVREKDTERERERERQRQREREKTDCNYRGKLKTQFTTNALPPHFTTH